MKLNDWNGVALISDLKSVTAAEVQQRLVAHGYLENNQVDGIVGPITKEAFRRFKQDKFLSQPEMLGKTTAQALLEEVKQHCLKNDFASSIIKYCKHKGYKFSIHPQEVNIFYVEGVSDNFKLNSDCPNEFNDLRIVIKFIGKSPIVVGSWQATCEPGRHYTFAKLNPKGAARIAFGQYWAWQVGYHRGDHESLVQTGGSVSVYRDANMDMQRTGDKTDVGYFGINQHWGYDNPYSDIGRASAGCLVGRSRDGHRQFMGIVKGDHRYEKNKKFIFCSTILPGDELYKLFPWR